MGKNSKYAIELNDIYDVPRAVRSTLRSGGRAFCVCLHYSFQLVNALHCACEPLNLDQNYFGS